ncbi:MAG: hypothetical protein PHE50_02970 [Dehalococcoidales bacterium]|nr:hypothetical protein [Dehalococcoidales bacterium]
MNQKAFIWLVVGIIVFAGSVGGAFAGGVAIGKKQAPVSSQFVRGQFPGGLTGRTNSDGSISTPPTGAISGFNRGTFGTVTKITGNVITLKTFEGNTINILTGNGTTYQKTGSGALSDVTVGLTISATGETQTDGSVKATTVFISPYIPTQIRQTQP